MSIVRLDQFLIQRQMVPTRSQAVNYIKLGFIQVNGKVVNKPGTPIGQDDTITINLKKRYLNRAALKLESVVDKLVLDFRGKVVLDVGSSTGGFTDFALKNGAEKVIAIDVGTDQMHASLRNDPRVELHEKTDIRQVKELSDRPDIVLVDVSFISLRKILPGLSKLAGPKARIAAMCKPQFEAASKDMNKGIVKNDTVRRKTLKDFEDWLKTNFLITGKADSEIPGAKGNVERFYLLLRKG